MLLPALAAAPLQNPEIKRITDDANQYEVSGNSNGVLPPQDWPFNDLRWMFQSN